MKRHSFFTYQPYWPYQPYQPYHPLKIAANMIVFCFFVVSLQPIY